MTIENALKILNETEATISAYRNAMATISYDGSTIAPAGSAASRADTMAVLSQACYQLSMSEDMKNTLYFLKEHMDELNDLDARRVKMLVKDFDRMSKIPMDEYVAYSRLLSTSDAVWHEAKAKNDFAMFLPYLEQVFATAKKFAGYIAPEKDPFAVYLDDCEEGFTREAADAFFNKVKEDLVPLIHKIKAAAPIDDSFLHLTYPEADQAKITEILMDKLLIDRNHCAWGTTEHPFTTSFSKYNVRLTTHFYENNLDFGISSTAHEAGHAQYELNCKDELYNTCLSGGASTAMHECSSRFFENMIGRDFGFMSTLLPEIQKIFPEQLKDVTAEQFYRACNKVVEPSMIRIRADELTYSLHILIRYEMERMYFDGELECKDFPAKWNELYKQYLDVDVPNDTDGVLQDTHWGSGLIGYFPSYSLGSAYAAQIYDAMTEKFDVKAALATGNIQPIFDYLKENLWQYGASRTADELLNAMTGKSFDPSHYTNYLVKKFSALYNI